MAETVGVVLLNMGGPESSDQLEPYLKNIFSDPAILDIPFGRALRPMLSRLIARRRAPVAAERYRMIGGGSPLTSISRRQAGGLGEALRRRGLTVTVELGMRYAPPFTRGAVEEISRFSADTIVGLSLYPHRCRCTSGSSVAELRREGARRAPEARLVTIESWPTLPAYVELLVDGVAGAVSAVGSGAGEGCCVVFSAHSVPRKVIDAGDPYRDEVETTYRAVVDRLDPGLRTELAFQSAVGPVEWIGPDTVDVVERLADEGFTTLIAVPLGFVAENIETLWDIEIDLFDRARRFGFSECVRVDCPNDDRRFIEGLADLVVEAVGGTADAT